MLLPTPIIMEGYSTVILSSAPTPLSTMIGCLDLCSALQIATPTMPSTPPHWHRRCRKPLSLPLSRLGRHCLGPAVPTPVLVLPQLSTCSRLLNRVGPHQSFILDDPDKNGTWQVLRLAYAAHRIIYYEGLDHMYFCCVSDMCQLASRQRDRSLFDLPQGHAPQSQYYYLFYTQRCSMVSRYFYQQRARSSSQQLAWRMVLRTLA
jgi:hypothetical protein